MESRVEELYKLVISFLKKWKAYSEDLTQELVYTIYNRLDKYDPTKAEFSSFVWMNCRNYYLMSKTKKSIPTLSLDFGLTLKEEEDTTAMDLIIDTSETPLEQRLREEREAYVSYIYNNICSPELKDWLNGMTKKAIAEKYGISHSWCQQKIVKELQMLKETYGE